MTLCPPKENAPHIQNLGARYLARHTHTHTIVCAMRTRYKDHLSIYTYRGPGAQKQPPTFGVDPRHHMDHIYNRPQKRICILLPVGYGGKHWSPPFRPPNSLFLGGRSQKKRKKRTLKGNPKWNPPSNLSTATTQKQKKKGNEKSKTNAPFPNPTERQYKHLLQLITQRPIQTTQNNTKRWMSTFYPPGTNIYIYTKSVSLMPPRPPSPPSTIPPTTTNATFEPRASKGTHPAAWGRVHMGRAKKEEQRKGKTPNSATPPFKK